VDLSPRLAGALLAAASTLVALPASAQILNVQPLIAAPTDPKNGVTFAADASADVRRGNTQLVALTGSALCEMRRGRHLFFLIARGDYAEKAGDAFVSKDLEHFRYRITLKGPLEAEAFIQHDRDDFRRLALRALGGVGPRLHLHPFASFDAAIGAAVMVEHERFSQGPERDAGISENDLRLSTYLYLTTDVGPKLKLGNTTYVQPRLDRRGDIRLLNELAVIAKANDHLALKLTYTSAYDSQPPEGVSPLDTTLKGSIQVTF
jgi:putative salt-induced outer membrane protein YdiY